MNEQNPKPLNFLEQIIEQDLKDNTIKPHLLKFRFPPEPNGFLHIGHAKAICLNFGLGKKYKVPVNLRFDDTNPSSENIDFVNAIKKDIQWLGFKWTNECYASDYFEQLYNWAVELIKKRKAYVDSQTSEEIANQKGTLNIAGTQSPFRNRSIEENLLLFEKMKAGDFKESEHVLRAKIDMQSPNLLMRDPILYRVILDPHHRTGNNWHIYPMYDWAHGQSDYLEQISHSFCSLEFKDHRELYEWFLNHIYNSNKIRPKQREFARLNLSNTVMSKRKLADLVENRVVEGWDDPRMPTLSGMRRRGYPPEAIKNFIETIGISKRENLIEFPLLENKVREVLNKTASRRFAIINPLKLTITNYFENKQEYLSIQNNPEKPEEGTRQLPFSKTLYIEQEDFKEEASRKFFRLSLNKEVRLKYAYIIKAHTIIKDDNGKIIEVQCTYDPLSKSGSDTIESKRKVKGTIHWLCQKNAKKALLNTYSSLFLDNKPEETNKPLHTLVNPSSLKKSTIFIEESLTNSNPLETFQFERIGYFCTDENSTKQQAIFNSTVNLKEAKL